MKGLIKWGGFVGVMTVTVAWLGGLFHPKIAPAEVQKQPKEVKGLKVETVKAEEIQPLAEFSGTVIAKETARISTRIAGFVEKTFVDVGDKVKKGQLLMVIDPKDLLARKEALLHQIEATKARAWAAKRSYERLKSLKRVGGVTEQQIDWAKAQYEALENAVKALQASIKEIDNNLKYAKIKAPYDVEVYLPERFLGSVKVGQTLEVEVSGKTVKGRVKKVTNAVDPMSRSFYVKISLPENCNVVSGKSVYVKVPEPKKVKGIFIPKSAIFKWGDFTAVYVVDKNGILHLRFVTLGLERDGKIEVLSGLKEGERIIVEGVNRACDGCKVASL